MCVDQPTSEVAIALVRGICCHELSVWKGEEQSAVSNLESEGSFTGLGRPGLGRNSDEMFSQPL